MSQPNSIDPLVSVIIPAYRAESTIHRAIDSVLAQTSAPAEIIVVDDGSPVQLESLLARYGEFVRCIRQANSGAAAARNAGIDVARGEWIAFLDADDTWEPHKLQRQLAAIRAHPDVSLVASRYFSQEPGVSVRQIGDCPIGSFDIPVEARGEALFRFAFSIWTGTVMLRRMTLAADRFVSGLEPAEDRELWIRMLARGRVIVLSEPLATAILEPDSLSRGDADSGYEPMIRAMQLHRYRVDVSTFRRFEADVYRAWAAAHLSAGKPRRAIRPALQRWRRKWISGEAMWIVAKSLMLAVIPQRQIRSADGRDEKALRRHYQIERSLADRLRQAAPGERRSLYGELYNELFARVHDHPQNRRKQSDTAQRASTARQLRLLDHFLTPTTRYLEIGAGDCHLAMTVARRVRRACAVDVSDIIASSGEKPNSFCLILSDGVTIDLPRGSIDLAYSNQLMEHLHPEDATEQLGHIRRSLAPGGKYVVITPHRHSGPHDISQFFAGQAKGFHLKEYTYRELRDLMKACGFDDTQVWLGLKGRFSRVPQSAVLMLEKLLEVLPPVIRRPMARSPVLRPLFINVCLVARVNGVAHADAHPMAEPTAPL